MQKTQEFFEEEVKEVTRKIDNQSENADLVFALVADSHLSDNGIHTRENIAAIDRKKNFRFSVHLGDLLTGGIPKMFSRKNLKEELDGYRNATQSRILYVAQGNHDGYRDETFKGQLVTDMVLDESWHEDTRFIDTYDNVVRKGDHPYYYVDYADLSLRMIFLCTNSYTIEKEKKEYHKIYGIQETQLVWLGEEALDVPQGYSIMVFSHIPPLVKDPRSSTKKYMISRDMPEFSLGFEAVELIKAFQRQTGVTISGRRYDYSEKNGSVVAWFFGHDHSDFTDKIDGIEFVGIASQTAYIPQLWEAMGEFPCPREMNTVNEDAWDTVIWKKAERKVFLYRFGSGEDRELHYE